MKKFIGFVLLTILFLGCNKDNWHTITVKGKILSEVSNEGIEGATLSGRSYQTRGNGYLSYSALLDSVVTKTDDDGRFSMELSYENNDDYIVLYKLQRNGEKSSGLLPNQKKGFTISELKENDDIKLYARRYKELRIRIMNSDPYDEEDSIRVLIFQDGTTYLNSIIRVIENFGDSNISLDGAESEGSTEPYWIGKNVNSLIYGDIQEGTTFRIRWTVIKNDIKSEYYSESITTTEDNSFTIEY